MAVFLALLLGVILAFSHYFSERLNPKGESRKRKLMSFVAGISVTYVFLLLLPEVYKGVEHLQRFLFLFILIGFAAFHLIEKHIYQHRSEYLLRKELKEAHSVAFFLYHIVIGMILVNLIRADMADGMLFFIPILFHTAVSGASLSGIHVSVRERILIRLVLSFSTLIGILFVFLIPVNPLLLNSLMGFVVGSFLYIVIRDTVPKETKGSPHYFILGIIIYALLISYVWVF